MAVKDEKVQVKPTTLWDRLYKLKKDDVVSAGEWREDVNKLRDNADYWRRNYERINNENWDTDRKLRYAKANLERAEECIRRLEGDTSLKNWLRKRRIKRASKRDTRFRNSFKGRLIKSLESIRMSVDNSSDTRVVDKMINVGKVLQNIQKVLKAKLTPDEQMNVYTEQIYW